MCRISRRNEFFPGREKNFNSYTDLVHFEKKDDMQKWDSDGFGCRILEHYLVLIPQPLQ